jgi:hypothetical protein
LGVTGLLLSGSGGNRGCGAKAVWGSRFRRGVMWISFVF